MTIEDLAISLGVKYPRGLSKLQLYDYLRSHFFDEFKSKYSGAFQSPSIEPSAIKQRSDLQIESEHSVYQRSDYTPLTFEKSFNSLYQNLGRAEPRSLMFGSGMAAISSLIYYLYNCKKIKKLCLAENAYFETKWIAEDYGRFSLFNEYELNLPCDCDVYWLEYPVNCTHPDKYPFEKQIDMKKFFDVFLKIISKTNKNIHLVIDYTLFYIPFCLEEYVTSLPKNLTIYFVTSLQKHRGYGLDLTNGGVITYYSHHPIKDHEALVRTRAIMGSSITQETIWLMPQINNRLINRLITDSGHQAKKIFYKCNKDSSGIRLYYSDNDVFLTSFIFVKIDKELMKFSTKRPYFSDRLIAEIIESARRNNAIIVNGTSFGLPFTRIFKNSERYFNTDSLRIAVGYDEELNLGVAEAIQDGISSFLKKTRSKMAY